MNEEIARKQLEDLMRKHGNHGAQDSEGWQAIRQVEDAADKGKPFPFTPKGDNPFGLSFNPFQLYESVPGWEQASQELVAAAEAYWGALIEKKLGITIVKRGLEE